MHYVWLGVAALGVVLLLAMLSGGDRRDASGGDGGGSGPSGDPELDEYLQARDAERRFRRDDPWARGRTRRCS